MASLQVQGRLSKLKSIPYWLGLRRRLSSNFLEDESSIRGRSMRSGGGAGSGDQVTETPPEPIPNRPLRGQGNPKPEIQFRNRRPSADNKQDGFDFLEKFKLGAGGGFGNKGQMPRNPQNLAQQEQQQEDGKADTSPPPSPAPQDANEIFKRLKETSLIPNAVAMLDGLCKDGLVQEAMKLFGLMREKGNIPEVVIYTAVVEGFCRARKFDDAKRIFRKMQNNGISPNAFSYSVLIQGMCQFDELEDAVAFSVEMLEAGHSPNVPTFLGLVARLCSQKGVEEARTVIATLTQKGFFVDKKVIKEHMEKKPTHPSVREAIFGNDTQERPFQF